MRHRLLFVANLSVWKGCLTSLGEANELFLVTPDFRLMHEAGRCHLNFIDIWNYLSDAEIEDHDERAWHICDELARRLKKLIVYDGIDLIDRCRNDLYFVINSTLNLCLAVNRVIDCFPPVEILIPNVPEEPLYWDPPTSSPGLFSFVIRQLAEVQGHKLRMLNIGEEDIDPVRNRDKRENDTELKYHGHINRKIEGILFGEGLYQSEIELFMEKISNEGLNSKWVLVSDRNPKYSLPYINLQSLKGLPFQESRNYFENKEIRQTVSKTLRELLSYKKRQELGRIPDIITDHFLSWLHEAAQYCHMATLLTNATRPGIVLTGYDIYGRIRCLGEKFQKLGVRAMSVDHVCLATRHNARRNKGASSGVAVWGENDALSQKQWRENDEVITVGSMRKDIRDANVQSCSQRVVSNNSFSICIFTTQTTHCEAMWTWAKPGKIKESWFELKSVIQKYPHWTFCIHSHPRGDYHAFYKDTICQHPNVMKEPKGSILNGIDVAVLMNLPSKVCLEVMTQDVPVIYLRDTVLANFESPLDYCGIPVAHSVAELESQLLRLSTDAGYRKHVVETGRLVLNKALVATGNEACSRLMRYVDDVKNREKSLYENCMKPDPASRWVLDYVHFTCNLREGGASLLSFIRSLWTWNRQGLEIDVSTLDMLVVVAELGKYFLECISCQRWRRGQISRIVALIAVYIFMPEKMRPTLSLFLYDLKIAVSQS